MVKINPSSFVEGGAVPVDRNLTWKDCIFNLFDYTKKSGEIVATTVAAKITYVDDDGTEYEQQYSAGDPERFAPSKDGKSLVAIVEGAALSKSSNFYLLMNALVNAGFPENKLDEGIDVLNGLYTHNIGLPEPKRSGLARPTTEEGARERVISVPDQILKLPGAKKGTKAKAGAAVEEATGDVIADAVAIVAELLEDADATTRQQVATKAIRAKKQAVAKLVFTEEFEVALLANGYSLDGEDITAS